MIDLLRIGESDCEFLRDDHTFAQPINTITSFAYVVVGLGIVIWALRHRSHRAESLVFGALVAFIGIGSVLFHGPQPVGSKVLHDLPIALAILFIVAHDLELVIDRFRHALLAFFVVGTIAAGLTIWNSDLAAPISGLGVAILAVLEIIIYRTRRRAISTRRQRRGYLVIIVVMALAGASYLLGRTDSPLCDPRDNFQFHGVWHVVSSLIFGLWWWLAIQQVQRSTEVR